MPTPEQQALIGAISRELQADPRIEAAWLAGSLGKGEGDAFSDVDVLALVTQASIAAVSADLARDMGRIAEPVLVNSLYGGAVLNVVASDWSRFDISFVAPDMLARYDAGALTRLFNRGELEPPRAEPAPYRPSPERVLQLATEFIRVLGLAAVVLGRKEYVTALSGVDMLRRMLMDLMVEENRIGPAERGGALHMNRLLTAEQRALLSALAPVAPERDSIIQAHVELARLFLPRARGLADEVGAVWPDAFEAATRRRLQTSLGALV